jgi:hypothetical protein
MQAIKLGVSAILHKPFTSDSLRRTISEATQLYSNGAKHR